MALGVEALQKPRFTVVQGLRPSLGEAECGVGCSFQSRLSAPQEKLKGSPYSSVFQTSASPGTGPGSMEIEYLWQGVMNEHSSFILSFGNVAGGGWEGGADSENGSVYWLLHAELGRFMFSWVPLGGGDIR